MRNKSLKNSYNLSSMGGRLKAWRKSLSLRLTDVSKMIDVSQGSLSDLENDNCMPSATTLTNLCLYTEMDIYWLLTGKEIDDVKTEGDSGLSQKYSALISQDQELKDNIGRLIRISRYGDPAAKAHLSGFLTGADPQKNQGSLS